MVLLSFKVFMGIRYSFSDKFKKFPFSLYGLESLSCAFLYANTGEFFFAFASKTLKATLFPYYHFRYGYTL